MQTAENKFKVKEKSIVIPNVQEDQDFVAALEKVKEATQNKTTRKAIKTAVHTFNELGERVVFLLNEKNEKQKRIEELEAKIVNLEAQVQAKEIILEAVTKAKSIAA